MGGRWCGRSVRSATSLLSTVTARGATSSRNSAARHGRVRGEEMRMKLIPWILLAALGIGGAGAANAQEKVVKVGIARSTSNAAELMALKHGHLQAAGF